MENNLEVLFETCYNNDVFDIINVDGFFNINSEEAILRRRVNSVLFNTESSNFEKLEEIILLTIDYHNHTKYIPNFEELCYLVEESQKENKKLLTAEEISTLSELITLRSNLKNDLISKNGLKELYPQYYKRVTKNRLKFDPLNLYKRGGDIIHLFNMVETSDVLKIKNKVKPPNLKKVLNNLKNITHKQFLYEVEIFSLWNESVALKKLEQVSNEHKFKITPDAIKLLKKLRRQKIFGEPISFFDLSELEREIGSVNFRRVPKILWKGFKKELLTIYRCNNLDVRRDRLEVLLKYYHNHKGWILSLIDKYFT